MMGNRENRASPEPNAPLLPRLAKNKVSQSTDFLPVEEFGVWEERCYALFYAHVVGVDPDLLQGNNVVTQSRKLLRDGG
jgi:hypothetical protein